MNNHLLNHQAFPQVAQTRNEFDNSDWSGRHVRLRFQMIAAALLIYLLCTTKPKVLNIGIIRYESEFPIEKFFWLLFAYLIYAIFAFTFRSSFEYSRWTNSSRHCVSRAKQIKLEQIIAEELYQEVNSNELANNLQQLISIENYKIDDAAVELVTSLNEFSQNGIQRDFGSKLSAIQYNLSELVSHSSALNSAPNLIAAEFSNCLTPCSEALGGMNNAISQMQTSLRNYPNDDDRSLKDLQSNLSYYFNRKQRLNKYFPNFAAKIKNLQKSEAKRNLLYFVQNFVFSVFVPLLATIILIFFAIDGKYGN